LRSCPGLKILASSREALGIAGEIAYRVPSLKTPNPDLVTSLIELSQLDAIRLFMDRAAVARPGFTMNESNAHFVAQICHRLDGIPLAIELAATRIKMLSPEQVAARLDDRFRLLTGGARTALPRQQTLRAMIDWSYSLLSEKERILFRRLAVFVGGWTLEAAESICADAEPNSATPIPQFEILDLLTHLVDKSLVSIEEAAGAARYNYLETIRQYAREKFFETDEVESIRDRHLAYHARFSEESEKAMQGPGRNAWSRRSEAEQDNLRAAMDWGLVRDPAKATLIASNLVIGITSGGFSIEGFRWLRDSMEKMQTIIASMPPALRARAYIGLSFVHLSLGDNQKSKAFAEQSVSLFRELNDRNSLASALLISSLPREFMGELEEAEAALHEALTLARAVKNAFITAWALNLLARVTARRYGNLDEALHFTDESIRVSKEAGIEFTAANAYEMRGFIAAEKGHYEEALMLYEKAMLAFQEIGASFNVILNKSNIAHLERQFGHDGRALECYRETIQEFRDVGQTGAVAHQLECFGFIAMAHGQDPRAVRLFSAACRLRETADTPMTPDEQIYYDRQLEGLRNRMESSVFGEAWAEGSDFSMDEAITLALEGTL
ncbi:MAG: ATP-binding protein, partial [Syntrophothermus sp.]